MEWLSSFLVFFGGERHLAGGINTLLNEREFDMMQFCFLFYFKYSFPHPFNIRVSMVAILIGIFHHLSLPEVKDGFTWASEGKKGCVMFSIKLIKLNPPISEYFPFKFFLFSDSRSDLISNSRCVLERPHYWLKFFQNDQIELENR